MAVDPLLSVRGLGKSFSGGWLDRLLMRGGELVMALPWLYLLLAGALLESRNR